jgi:hypothetical protein
MIRGALFLLFIWTSVTVTSTSVLAVNQDSTTISFLKEMIDFQVIYEADGAVPVSFEFTNTGSAPLYINRIIAPGLSDISYPKKALGPGEKGIINASVNPFGRKGYYKKYLTVFTNTTSSPDQLTVKGKILHGSFKNSFNYSIGGLAFKQLQLNFGYIYKGNEMVRYIPVMNTSEKPLRVSFPELPEHLSINNKFEELAPKSSGLIEIAYNTNAINDWDFVIDKVKITIDNKETTEGEIVITSNIRENFSLLSIEDQAHKPKVSLPVRVFNFDTIAAGKKVNFEFPVYNKGSRDLNIRAVKPTCGCTAVMPEKNIIAPGDSTVISVEFNSIGFSGLNKKGVTLITNDPDNYKHFLWVTGYID